MAPPSPPPRKPQKPPARDRRLDARRDVLADALLALEADPETSGPRATADGQDPLDGEWLYKENDVVRGPIGAERLLEGAKEGAFSKDMPIAREVGQWRALHTVDVFADAWERGQTEREHAKQRDALEKKRARIKSLRVLVLALVFVFPFSACAVMSRTVVAARPWDDSDVWLNKAPPLIEIPPRVEKPVRIALAPKESPSSTDAKPETPPSETPETADKLAETPSSSKSDSGRRSRRRSSKAPKPTPDKKDDGKTTNTKPPEETKVAAAKIQEKLSDSDVNAGLKRGVRQIGACLKTETERNQAMPGTVTVAFSINNAGRAIQIKVLERQVRDGPLTPCLQKAIGRIAWPKTYGENRYVEVPFRIKKRS